MEELSVQVGHVEHVQRHLNTPRQREKQQGRYNDLLDKVVEPSGTEEQCFAIVAGCIGDAFAHCCHPLVQPFLFVTLHQVGDTKGAQ